MSAAVAAPQPGVVVWRRLWTPLYRAAVDGHAVRPVAANLHHLGVPVPAGTHRVRVWVDRRPLARSALGAGAGALLLAALAGLDLRRRRRPPAAVPGAAVAPAERR